MNYDIPSASPKDSSDLDKSLKEVDAWSTQVLRISRETTPTRDQERFTVGVNDMLSRAMARMLVSPQISVELPNTSSFNNAADGLKKSIDHMAEIAQHSGVEAEEASYKELRIAIGSIDMFDEFGRTSGLVKLLETNAAFMAGPESNTESARTNIEDGALELCAMYREFLEQNPEALNAIAKDSKITEDLSYVRTLAERVEGTEPATE